MPRGWSCVPLKRRPQRSDCGKAYALFPYGVHRVRAARPANPFEVPESSAISLFSTGGALTADFGTWYFTEKGIFGAYRGAARGALAKIAGAHRKHGVFFCSRRHLRDGFFHRFSYRQGGTW